MIYVFFILYSSICGNISHTVAEDGSTEIILKNLGIKNQNLEVSGLPIGGYITFRFKHLTDSKLKPKMSKTNKFFLADLFETKRNK